MNKRFRVSNYMILFVTILSILIVISVSATVRLNEKRDEKLIYAVETKVEYQAKRCYLEGNCEGNVTLGTLYDLKYLSEITDPITKEVLDYGTVITFNNGEYEFSLN